MAKPSRAARSRQSLVERAESHRAAGGFCTQPGSWRKHVLPNTCWRRLASTWRPNGRTQHGGDQRA